MYSLHGEVVFLSGEPKYYLIDAKVMPSIFHKVLKAKRLLESGSCRTASEAADMALLSRSAFYKYKDAIRPFFDKESDRIATFYAELSHTPGVLSHLLNCLTEIGLNILTLNQNIPVDGKATVTISAQMSDDSTAVNDVIETAGSVHGVIRFQLLAGN
ncbi:MAG: ACT domain-containing protein [Clostridia bacterium]|nr:ACT domain-containing protein [Clostridia bacterium]